MIYGHFFVKVGMELRGILLIFVSAMIVLSVLSLFELSIAGISILVGVIGFILYRSKRQDLFGSHELSLPRFIIEFKMKPNWFWLVLPLIMNVLSLSIAALFLPEFFTHLQERTCPLFSSHFSFDHPTYSHGTRRRDCLAGILPKTDESLHADCASHSCNVYILYVRTFCNWTNSYCRL